MQTALIENAPDEQPDQRPFGSQVVSKNSGKMQKFARTAAGAGAVFVVGLGGYAFYAGLSQEAAPKLNLEAARTIQTVAVQVTPVSVPDSPVAVAQTSPEHPAAAEQVPITETSTGAIVEVPNQNPQEQIKALTEKLDVLTADLQDTKAEVDSLKKNGRGAAAKLVVTKSKPDEFLALSVLDITAKGVVVSDSSKQYTVGPGAQLPGGATYIGFDPASRLMKTNRGDFLIP